MLAGYAGAWIMFQKFRAVDWDIGHAKKPLLPMSRAE
jgi:hypothetical protein